MIIEFRRDRGMRGFNSRFPSTHTRRHELRDIRQNNKLWRFVYTPPPSRKHFAAAQMTRLHASVTAIHCSDELTPIKVADNYI